jgi:limonene-1,2-epoxide hydrolase
MPSTEETLRVVRAYHQGWTRKEFEQAIRLLAPDLQVEVPINDYPDAESFAKALVGFGGMVKRVVLLAEFAQADQAMLLYDLEVDGVGMLRIAEHFTVSGGKITRIRQIHDTAALRAAGFGEGL